MKEAVLGLDTSNYRTSLAVVSTEMEIIWSGRIFLPVPPGERGLRQSDAVYMHLKQLKVLFRELGKKANLQISAVCASVSPRDREDSYMPVFEAGETAGMGIAAALNVPFFRTNHQLGHLYAARFGTRLEREEHFLALHLSGGTTDLLHVNGERCETIGSSLDLHAGQLVDRIGVSLGCSFPAGPELEKLAVKGTCEGRFGCAMTNGDLCCHFSGAESQAQRWIRENAFPPEVISRETYDLLVRTVSRMLTAGAAVSETKDALIFGGIASSALFRCMLTERLRRMRSPVRAVFGEADLSGDNAVGVALIGADRLNSGMKGEL